MNYKNSQKTKKQTSVTKALNNWQ